MKDKTLQQEGDTIAGGNKITVGEIIRDAISLHELDVSVIESQLDFPNGVIVDVMQDKIYTNNIPVLLFRNLIVSLHIPFAKIEAAMLPTFRVMVSNETVESIKKKPHGYMLWENEESVIKYTNRLKEIMSKNQQQP